MLSLANCSIPTNGSSPTVSANPCLSILLPDYDMATRAEMAKELRNAQMKLEWPREAQDYYRLRAAVGACQVLE